jgi:hypothetical protein
MKNKFRKLLICAGYMTVPVMSCAAQNLGAWSDSPVGKCFASVQDFMVQRYGADYASDENIKTTPMSHAGSNLMGRIPVAAFVWVMDITPGTNITRTLLMGKRSRQTCAILYAPLSSDVSLKRLTDGGLPDVVVTNDTPPPGLNGNRIVYRLDRKSNTYSPQKCYRINPAKIALKTSCALAFSDQ